MSDAKCGVATPYGTLLEQILDPTQPKSEREWAASHEIEQLRQQVKDLEDKESAELFDAKRIIKMQREELAELKQSQGEPVATVMRNKSGQIFMAKMDGNSFDMSEYVGKTLYTAPTIPETTLETLRHFAWQHGESNTVRKMDEMLGGNPTERIRKKYAAPKPEDVK